MNRRKFLGGLLAAAMTPLVRALAPAAGSTLLDAVKPDDRTSIWTVVWHEPDYLAGFYGDPGPCNYTGVDPEEFGAPPGYNALKASSALPAR